MSCAKRLPGCCGPSSFTTTTSTGGSRSMTSILSKRIGVQPRATSTGITCTTRTSSRCRTNGNTLGTPLGTWPFMFWLCVWSTIFAYRVEKARQGKGDVDWLERSFQKLLLNFTWWVNRKDRTGRSAYEGGFLGLDNVGVFDRSAPLPTGGDLEQADGTAWMALYCQ